MTVIGQFETFDNLDRLSGSEFRHDWREISYSVFGGPV